MIAILVDDGGGGGGLGALVVFGIVIGAAVVVPAIRGVFRGVRGWWQSRKKMTSLPRAIVRARGV